MGNIIGSCQQNPFSRLWICFTVSLKQRLPLNLNNGGSSSGLYICSDSSSIGKNQESQRWTHNLLAAGDHVPCSTHRGQEDCDTFIGLAHIQWESVYKWSEKSWYKHAPYCFLTNNYTAFTLCQAVPRALQRLTHLIILTTQWDNYYPHFRNESTKS